MDKLPTVRVRKQVLFAILWESILHFKKECSGVLFGSEPTEAKNYFSITDALFHSDVKVRKFKETQVSRKTKRVYDLVNTHPNLYPLVSSFHSHPEWGKHRYFAVPSDTDLEGLDLQRMGDRLLIIVGMHKYKGGSSKKWKHTRLGGLSGYMGGYYFYINAFTLDPEIKEKKALQLKLRAPEALKTLNRVVISKK